jgi:ferredoxin-nitrite reductase
MAVPGCKIFVGGKIGEEGHLALEPFKENIPLDEEDLIPVLVDILKTQFGATDKKPAAAAAAKKD